MGQRPRVVLKRGEGKDGNPSFRYVRDHPTNYVWEPRIEKLTKRLVNMDPFHRRIWVNTYFDHPPGVTPRRDKVSFDVWGFGGRGDPLDVELGWRIRRLLFRLSKKRGGPNIAWIIWRGRMWEHGVGPKPSPPGPRDSDPKHLTHLHVTYL